MQCFALTYTPACVADFGVVGLILHRFATMATVNITKKAKPNSDQLVIDGEILEEVFGQPDVVDKPIAIYAIAGAFRKGKSFLLNLLCRYLTFAYDKKEDEWLSDLDADVGAGFSWRGGRKKDTEGIVITKRPFFLKNDQGEEVAIFLMDTEGVFHNESTTTSDSRLFALSCLISSFQMFNLMSQVNSADLKHLTVFAEFGKMAQLKHNSKSVYQTLQFLVRDWEDLDTGFGLAGGEIYLREVFGHNSIENKSVCNNINITFETTECFLMPDPGKQVRTRKAEATECSLKEVDKEFRQYLHNLAHHLFDKPTLKRVNGVVQRGSDMINLCLLYSKKLAGKNISPELLYEANAELTMAKVMSECEKLYNDEVEKLGNDVLTHEEVTRKHQQIVQRTLEYFDNQKLQGDDDFIIGYRKYWEECCQWYLQTFQAQIHLNNAATKNYFQRKAADGRIAYENDVNALIQKLNRDHSFIVDDQFETVSTAVQIKALEKFTKSTFDNVQDNFGTNELHSIVQDERSHYLQLLQRKYLPLEKQLFRHRSSLQKKKVRLELWNWSVQQLTQYDRSMSELRNTERFETMHEEISKKALRYFDTHATCASDLCTDLRRAFLTAIEVRKELYHTTASLNQEIAHAASDSSKLLREIKQFYQTKMNEKTGKQYVNENVFNREEAEVLETCLKMLHTAVIPIQSRQECNKLAENVLENEKTKEKQRLEVYKTALEQLEAYVNNFLQIIAKSQFTKNILRAQWDRKEKVLKDVEFQGLSAYSQIKDDLENSLNSFYDIMKRKQKNEMEEKRCGLEQQLQYLIVQYNSDIRQVLQGKFAKPEDFKRLHTQLKAAYIKAMKHSFGSDLLSKLKCFIMFKGFTNNGELEKEYVQRLENSLDRFYSNCWVRVNQIHKKFYTRHLSSVGSYIGAAVGGVLGIGLAAVEIIFIPGVGWILGAVTITRSVLFGASAGHFISQWIEEKLKI